MQWTHDVLTRGSEIEIGAFEGPAQVTEVERFGMKWQSLTGTFDVAGEAREAIMLQVPDLRFVAFDLGWSADLPISGQAWGFFSCADTEFNQFFSDCIMSFEGECKDRFETMKAAELEGACATVIQHINKDSSKDAEEATSVSADKVEEKPVKETRKR